MKKIRVAIAGIGNCASALVQGLFYYRQAGCSVGLLYPSIGGYSPVDIQVVASFDVDSRKVGQDLSRAIFAGPNCTLNFCDVPFMDVPVLMGPVLDGAPDHLKAFVQVSTEKPVDIAKVLKETETEVLVNLLPTGSASATRAYADAALGDAGVAFINGIPEMIACDGEYAAKSSRSKVPLIGDDFKSQIGTTILHRSLIRTLLERGIKIDKMFQYNFAGNTDFANLERRGESKEISKVAAIEAEMPFGNEVRWGFAPMFVACQDDIKTGVIHIQGRNFGGNTVNVDLKVEVDDSANAAGVMVDMIRCAKIALDREMGGVLEPVCAFYAKHPPKQFHESEAKQMLDRFILGKPQ